MTQSAKVSEGGLRKAGKFHPSPVTPLFSIITVVFNGENFLEETIQSVISQSYPNIEYIIIDGASNDSTLDIIRKHEKKIAYWKSEKDKGIYDAMNKGLSASTGDYVWFINAGDLIESDDTIEKIVKDTGNNLPDIIYGETNLIDSEGLVLGTRSELTTRQLPEALTWKKMGRGMVVSHQSIIVKRSIATSYNDNFFCSADIDWVIRSLKGAKSIHYARFVLSRYLTGGTSIRHRKKCLKERLTIYLHHYGIIETLINHVIILLRAGYYFLFHREKLKF